MQAEKAELQRREMAEMMEAMQIAEAQRATETQMQQTLQALEAQKFAFQEQAWQKQRAAELMRAERAERMTLLQRQLEMETRSQRPASAQYLTPAGLGSSNSTGNLASMPQRAWSAQPQQMLMPSASSQLVPTPQPLGPPSVSAWEDKSLPISTYGNGGPDGWAAPRTASGWNQPEAMKRPESGYSYDSPAGNGAYGRRPTGSAPGAVPAGPELSSPGPSLGAMEAMGPGQPLLSPDTSTTTSGEYANIRQKMYEEFEAEKARMAAELRALEEQE
jgi:hypothetical protein